VPLLKGSSNATISKNIHEMVKAGHPQNQAVAASLSTAYGKMPSNKMSFKSPVPAKYHK
jgi:hypothetical protein